MNTNTRGRPLRGARSCEFTDFGIGISKYCTAATRAGPQRQTKLVMLLLSVQSTLYETRRDTRAVRSRRVLEMRMTSLAARRQPSTQREERERETKRALCSVVMGRDWLDVIEPRRCQISARRTRLPLRLSPRLHVRPRAARQNIPPNYIVRKDVHLHHPFNPDQKHPISRVDHCRPTRRSNQTPSACEV